MNEIKYKETRDTLSYRGSIIASYAVKRAILNDDSGGEVLNAIYEEAEAAYIMYVKKKAFPKAEEELLESVRNGIAPSRFPKRRFLLSFKARATEDKKLTVDIVCKHTVGREAAHEYKRSDTWNIDEIREKREK